VEQGFDLPAKVLEWRGLAKLKSTYVDGLLAAINPKTGRVHTSYSMAGTSTGRLSSSDPNLQNIPIRSDRGRQIRQAFIAEKGHKLLSLDYSQIELRLLAEMADVPQLSKAFKEGKDIHIATASQMFGIPLEQVTGEVRRRAKAINFGIIYGISAFGLAQQLSIPQGEAAGYIKSYFEKYPGISDYMETTKAYAREHGYVKTLFGRKCFTPGIHEKTAGMRGFAERQAINAPLQGTNADIIKQAMHRIPQALQQHNLQARMLLQVHDELIFEVPEAEVDNTTQVLQQLMESIVHLNIPLVVGVGVGDNWDEAH
jgi:DNA polymerase-1